MTPAAALLALALAAAPPDGTDPGQATVRDLFFLADGRPVFLRLRLTTGGRPFDAAWPGSVKAVFDGLDRDGDGTLTAKEADVGLIAALVRLATGDVAAAPRGEPDADPKDGVVSTDELAGALRPTLGPFRILVGPPAVGRTDALFDHLDRDKDGMLTRAELSVVAGSLRRLDLDDNEMISPDELEPFRSPGVAQPGGLTERRARFAAVPPVVETVAGESSLRLARLLLKRYDTGRPGAPDRPDGKLSAAEFAVIPDAFEAADRNGDGMLDTEDLRRYLADATPDLVLDVDFPVTLSGRVTTRVGGGAVAEGVKVRQLADGDVEFAVGLVRLDVKVHDGRASAESVHRAAARRFQAADANKDGYLDGKELSGANNSPSPLVGLTGLIDRDGDGKLYAKELDDFVGRQLEAARGRLVLTVSDQGRAIFGVLDLDRDRRLGARELLRAVDRVTSWDADGDNRIAPDEVPYHFLVTLSRGELRGLSGDGLTANGPQPMSATLPLAPGLGPEWFRRMDRNRDGDVSRREFLGPREQFDRIDRDRDGLIDPNEAAAVDPAKKAPEGGTRP
jgi:Ca2+-binding EF-hand superfamily protein